MTERQYVLPYSAANVLSAIGDINAQVTWANQAGTNGVNPEVFYSLQLLETIREDSANYTYYRYAESAPIQDKADKLVMRRWAPLQAHIVPLSEGVPPMSDKGSMEKYELQAFQYGRYMEFTDKVDFKVVDPVVAHYSKEYSIVAVETLDLLARKELLRVSQKFLAGGATGVGTMTIAACKPKIADLRLIKLSLTRQKVKPRENGKYHVLCSEEFIYDMMDDPYVQNYMNYNNTTTPMYENGTMVPMFGFDFYVVPNCPDHSEFVNASNKRSIVVYKKFTSGDSLNGKTYTQTDADEQGFIYGLVEESTTNLTTASGYVKDKRTQKDASYIPGQETWLIPSGWKQLKIHHILILGKDALLKTGMAGEDSAKMYVKPLGSSGVLDPVDQRQSIGFKINNVGFGSTRVEAVVDYMCIPTQANV